MLFTTIPFTLFFVVFFCLYWFVFGKSLKLQNLLILTGSYIFYAWWDWRFLFLLVGFSLIIFLLGGYMSKTQSQRTKNMLMYTGTVIGLGLLLYFKYTNFFILSFMVAFAKLHVHLDIHTLDIILPIGISFYTFRALSYLFDIHKGKTEPTDDWVVFFSFVAFFPCLLSGPIDKSKTLIPQLERKREFTYEKGADAMRQILWGFFKKMVIADGLAGFTNDIYANYHTLSASTLLMGIFYFAIQLYADFSGYSDMAIGIARLLGFNVTKNFNFPFFAQNIADFWRRWHISLTTWLTDYVFTPLSITFRDYDTMGLIMAILVNFTLIGIWHGSNLTFVLFGFLHGCFYIPLILKGTLNKKNKLNPDKALPTFKELIAMLQTFILASFSFILFRSDNIRDAFGFFKRLFSKSLLSLPSSGRLFIPIVIILLVIEWIQRNKEHVLQIERIRYASVRWGIYLAIIIAIGFFFRADTKTFMYVKF